MPPLFSREMVRPLLTKAPLRNQARTSPCESVCPAGNPIQKVHELVKEKQFEAALEFLRARNPFPGVTGRICTHPCEKECNRREWDEALNIRAIERAAADSADRTRIRKPLRRERTGKRVAVIGGGPAGLSFAYFAGLLGHEVTVFEAGPTLGGIPRLCVPQYRLPKDVLDMEIGLVLEAGVKARTNVRVGREIPFAELRASHDAVLIASGAWQERVLPVPNAGLGIRGVEFLRKVMLGFAPELGRRVVVLGGGGVAFDCAFTARRLGAEEVHVVCLEKAEAMVAPADDLVQAKAENIQIHNACMVLRVLEKGGRAAGIEFQEIEDFCFDEKGEAKIGPACGLPVTIEADSVIFSVGIKPELSYLEGSGIVLNPKGTVKTDPVTGQTSLPGVFAAGDAATGPAIAAAAVGSGREAALACDRYLMGKETAGEVLAIAADGGIVSEPAGTKEPHVVKFAEMFNPEYYAKTPRREGTVAPALSFTERHAGLDGQAAEEAGRCFRCGHCQKCGKCVEDCPGLILVLEEAGPAVKYADECWHCGNCRTSCPGSAVSYEFPLYTLV